MDRGARSRIPEHNPSQELLREVLNGFEPAVPARDDWSESDSVSAREA